MAMYTMEIYELIQALTGQTAPQTMDEMERLTAQAADMIFAADYPYYNPAGRRAFAIKFLNHFMWHEICTVPWAKWRHILHARLAEIMPRYTELWQTVVGADYQYDPLETVRVDYNGDKKRQEDTDYTHSAGQESTTADVTTSGTSTATANSRQNATGQEDASNTWGRQRGDGQSDSSHTDTSETDTTTDKTDHATKKGANTNLRRYSDTPQNNMPVQADPNGNIILQYLTNVTYDNGTNNEDANGSAHEDGNTVTTASSEDSNTSATGAAQESHGHAGQSVNTMETGESTTSTTTDTTVGTDYAQREDAHNVTDFDYSDDWREHRQGHEVGTTYQQLVQQSRDLIIEFDREILNLCNDCFMLIY